MARIGGNLSGGAGDPEAGLIERKGILYDTNVSHAKSDAGEVFEIRIPPARTVARQ